MSKVAVKKAPRLCQRCQRGSHEWCPGWQSGDGESVCECECPRAQRLASKAVKS